MRENKKIVSRTWLVIINLISFLVSIAIMALGIMILKSAKSASEKASDNIDSSSVDVDSVQNAVYNLLKTIGITLTVYGAFIVLTSICGFFGGCTRNDNLLSCYMSTLAFDVLLTIGIMIFAIVSLQKKVKEWDGYSEQDWVGFSNSQKDYYQIAYGCCGYDSNQSNAYTGKSFYLEKNDCAADNKATFPGCHDAGHNYFSRLTTFTGVSGGVILLILFVSIGAAHHARRSYKMDAAAQPIMVVQQNKY
ncbi:hypothetical protein HDU97_009061 [Phlyctochytrium planicorne]|nr:hypothetical protein HDU97_009061 [Phlyctochytrium planicorne]